MAHKSFMKQKLLLKRCALCKFPFSLVSNSHLFLLWYKDGFAKKGVGSEHCDFLFEKLSWFVYSKMTILADL